MIFKSIENLKSTINNNIKEICLQKSNAKGVEEVRENVERLSFKKRENQTMVFAK